MRKLLLWLWPKLRGFYGRYELQVDLLDMHDWKEQTAPAQSASVPGAHSVHRSTGIRVPGAHIWILLLFFAAWAHAAPAPDSIRAVHNAFRGYSNPFRMSEPMEPQGGAERDTGNFRFDGSYNLLVNCITGCSASSGFADNGAFTVGTTPINIAGALYTTSAPSISTGNAGRVRMDSSSYLYVDCIVGCSASAGFSDNSAFTAGTTAVGITGGWYSASPTNCTSGNACAPQLTIDRKLFVQAFQGTSPWVVSANGGSFAVTGTFWQTTQPVSCTAANCLINVTQWDSTALGAPSAYGTSPGAVNVPGVNAYITNTPAVTGSGNFTVVQGTGSNLHMVCDSGCSSSAGFADNSAFTVGTTAINPIGGLYDTGADPSISNGNAGRARIDSHSYLLVDGSQVTQPVSGTFWQSTQPVSLASLPALVAGSAIVGKVGIDQTTPGITNAVQDTNFPSTVDTNTGNASASTIREAIATNNPAIAAWGQGATGSAVPAGAVYGAGNGSGNLKGYINCDNTYVNNGLASSGSTQAVALSSGKSIYICDFFVNTASTTAVNVKLVYGTGTNCATSPSDLSILVPMQAPSSVAPAGQNVTPPVNTLWSTPASQAVCVNLSAAQTVNVMFHYTQF